MQMARDWGGGSGLLNAATSACTVDANPQQEDVVSAQ